MRACVCLCVIYAKLILCVWACVLSMLSILHAEILHYAKNWQEKLRGVRNTDMYLANAAVQRLVSMCLFFQCCDCRTHAQVFTNQYQRDVFYAYVWSCNLIHLSVCNESHHETHALVVYAVRPEELHIMMSHASDWEGCCICFFLLWLVSITSAFR